MLGKWRSALFSETDSRKPIACSTTFANAIGNGFPDALAGGLAGIVPGSGIFAALYPRLRFGILKKGAIESVILPQLFKVNAWFVVIPVAMRVVFTLVLLKKSGF